MKDPSGGSSRRFAMTCIEIPDPPHIYLESNFPYDPGGTMICQLQFQLDTQENYTYQHIHQISSSQALHT